MENGYHIQTRDLVKTYPMGHSKITALDKVNLSFRAGEFAGLVGPSGSGKTTFLNIVGSLDSPTEGSAAGRRGRAPVNRRSSMTSPDSGGGTPAGLCRAA